MPTREYTLPSGTKLRHGIAFRIENVASFPANWLELATESDLTRYQITVAIIPDPPPPPLTAADVRAEAERRIEAIYPATIRENRMLQVIERLVAGQAVSNGMRAAVQWVIAMRATGETLAAQSPIPADYATNETYWPARP